MLQVDSRGETAAEMPITVQNDDQVVTVAILRQTLNEVVNNALDIKLAVLNEVREENAQLKQYVETLESKIDALESYSRRNNIVVHGIPTSTDENPVEVSIKLGEAIGVILAPTEIDAAHRLPSKNKNAPPPLIIKFVSRLKRDEIFTKVRRAKLTDDKTHAKIYCNEHLTAKNQFLRTYAKCLWERYIVWARNGSIFCRSKEEGSRAIRLATKEDVDKLKWENNDPNYSMPTTGQKRTIDERSPKGTGNEWIKQGKKQDQKNYGYGKKNNK